eukprot:18329-Heterococcus_DN1.PRE.1
MCLCTTRLHQHRDLKPGNLLVTKSCQLRITDFGLARERPLGRGADPDEEVDDPMTEHVVTRWYRPPELMLCPDGLYTYAVDLWSVGCIFAELLGRQPLFPGNNFVDQLTLIFGVIGSPSAEEVAHIRNNQARRFLESVAGKPKVPYASLFPQASEYYAVSGRTAGHIADTAVTAKSRARLLVFDPPKRLSVSEALDHPYFEALRQSEGAKEDPVMPPGLQFDFETQGMARLQLKQLILQEQDVSHSFNKQHSVNISQIILQYVLQGVATAAELNCCLALNSPILKLTSATAAVAITLQQVDSFRREQRRKDRERERARPSSGSDSRQQQRGEASSKHRDDADVTGATTCVGNAACAVVDSATLRRRAHKMLQCRGAQQGAPNPHEAATVKASGRRVSSF